MITTPEDPRKDGWRVFGVAVLIGLSAFGLVSALVLAVMWPVYGLAVLITLSVVGIVTSFALAIREGLRNLGSELITTAQKPGKRTRRILVAALLFSALIHPLLIALGLLLFGLNLPNLIPQTAKRPAPKDELVTVSTSPRHARRVVAAAGAPHRAAQSARPQPKVAYVPPHPQVIPQPPVPPVRPRVVPTPEPTPRPRVEVAKIVPRAPSVPKPAEHPNQIKPVQHTVKEPERVAYQPPHTAQQPSRFTPEQIAQINADLARAVQQDRQPNVLSNATPAAAAASTMKRYAMDFSGVNARFGGAQGICHTEQEWFVGDLVYMYDSCRVLHANGSTTTEILPWPVHYHKRPPAYIDPNSGLWEGPPGSEVPWPDPDWRPTPGKYIDPDILAALREHGYRI